jgi:protein FAM32A
MPLSDYATAAGGSLKLKGVKGSKVEKPKKKKKRAADAETAAETAIPTETAADTKGPRREGDGQTKTLGEALASEDEREERTGESKKEADRPGEREGHGRMKTEAEKRHEEQRRKRVGSSLFPARAASLAFSAGQTSRARAV